jgi:hypothetical protein
METMQRFLFFIELSKSLKIMKKNEKKLKTFIKNEKNKNH